MSASFKKYRKVILLSLPLLIGIGCLLVVYRSPLYIISAHATDIEMNAIAQHDNNTPPSTIELTDYTKAHLQFRYLLRSGVFIHYARTELFKSDHSLLDLRGYQLMTVKIKARKGRRLQIGIIAPDSSAEDGRPYISNISVDNQYQEISVPVEKILTPYWWFAKYNKKETEFPLQDFSKIKSFTIANCLVLDYGIEDTVDVLEWSFKFDIKLFFIKWLSVSCFYYLVYVLVFYIARKRKSDKANNEININYEKLNLPDNSKKDIDLVVGYMEANFAKEDMSIEDVQLATGLQERRISTVIKDQTGQNFKSYLNHLRMEAAKELLQKTDLPIADIAFRVGYSNVTHFNRVFKASINCSPKDYRKSLE